MIAASELEYMFITVTCCEEIAKKVFEHFFCNYLHNAGTQILASASATLHHCIRRMHHRLPNSRTFPGLALRFPGPNSFSGTFKVLEILQTELQDFPGGVGTLCGWGLCGMRGVSMCYLAVRYASGESVEVLCVSVSCERRVAQQDARKVLLVNRRRAMTELRKLHLQHLRLQVLHEPSHTHQIYLSSLPDLHVFSHELAK